MRARHRQGTFGIADVEFRQRIGRAVPQLRKAEGEVHHGIAQALGDRIAHDGGIRHTARIAQDPVADGATFDGITVE